MTARLFPENPAPEFFYRYVGKGWEGRPFDWEPMWDAGAGCVQHDRWFPKRAPHRLERIRVVGEWETVEEEA